MTGERELDRVVPIDETMSYSRSDTGRRAFSCSSGPAILGPCSRPIDLPPSSRDSPERYDQDIRVINVDFPGPAGLLEGLINAKTGTEPRAIAVLGASAADRRRNHAHESGCFTRPRRSRGSTCPCCGSIFAASGAAPGRFRMVPASRRIFARRSTS